MLGRCLRCRKQVEIKDAEEVTMRKTGNIAVRGKCPICGTTIYRIIGKNKMMEDKNGIKTEED